MESAKSRFLRYVTYYTTSDEFTGTSPSTERQKDLGRALMQELQVRGFFRLDVLSPSRLQHRVFDRYGADLRQRIDERGKAMTVARALQQVKAGLSYYAGAEERPGFIRRMSGLIGTLKSLGLDAEALRAAVQGLEGRALAGKLSDSALVLESYEQLMAGQFCDAQDIQQDMLMRLTRSGMLENHQVFVYGFDVLTEELTRTLLCIAQQAEGLGVYMVSERAQTGDGDAFEPVRQSVERFMALLRERALSPRFQWLPLEPLQAAPEIRHMEAHLLAVSQEVYPDPPLALRLFAAPNAHREVQQAAFRILKDLERGVDIQDIVVLCGQLDSYRGLVSAIFSEWGIPFHVSDKQPLSGQAPARYLLAALRCAADGWREEDAAALIKSGLSDLSREEGWRLENYAITQGIRGSRWQSPFTRGTPEEAAAAEPLRLRLVESVNALQKALAQAKTAGESLLALQGFLKQSRVEEKCLRLEETLEAAGLLKEAMALRQALPLMQEMLDQMAALMGEERIPLKHFARWLDSGFEEKEIASLPPTSQCVQVGQLGNLLPHRPRCVYLLGLSEGSLSASENELLNEDEKGLVEERVGQRFGLSLQAREELALLDLWKAMSAAEEHLSLSYSLANEEGGVQQPLPELTSLQRLFPLLVEEGGALAPEEELEPLAAAPALDSLAEMLAEDDLPPGWQEAFNWLSADPLWAPRTQKVLDSLNGEQLRQLLSPALAGALFQMGSASITRLESFGGCPYQHFIRYGLRPVERKPWSVEPLDTGSFYHEALDGFLRLALSDERWPFISQEESALLVDRAMAPLTLSWDGLPFHDSHRMRKTADGYRALCRRMAWVLTRGAQNAGFRPEGTELVFGEGGDLPPLILRLADGESVSLRGKIDRLDRYEDGEGSFLRVVDYKSSRQALVPARIWAGLQLQLLIYLQRAITAFPEARPAGAFYQWLGDPIAGVEDPAQAEKEIFKELRLKGILINDERALRQIDLDGPLTYAQIFTQKGAVSKQITLFEEEEIRGLAAHALSRATQSAQRIRMGEILRSPARLGRQSHCEYCEYQGICRIDRMAWPSYRDLPRLSMDELRARLAEEYTE